LELQGQATACPHLHKTLPLPHNCVVRVWLRHEALRGPPCRWCTNCRGGGSGAACVPAGEHSCLCRHHLDCAACGTRGHSKAPLKHTHTHTHIKKTYAPTASSTAFPGLPFRTLTRLARLAPRRPCNRMNLQRMVQARQQQDCTKVWAAAVASVELQREHTSLQGLQQLHASRGGHTNHVTRSESSESQLLKGWVPKRR